MADFAPYEPLGLEEVKLNLRVNGSTEDAAIEELITDARAFVERETGLVLMQRTVTETAPSLGRWIDLKSWPVTAITAIRYPVAGVMTGLPDGAWIFSTARRPVRLLPAASGWGVGFVPSDAAALPVEIDVVAGYEATDLPRAVTRAMHLLIAHWYENRLGAEVGSRAAAIEVPFGVTALLRSYKLMRV